MSVDTRVCWNAFASSARVVEKGTRRAQTNPFPPSSRLTETLRRPFSLHQPIASLSRSSTHCASSIAFLTALMCRFETLPAQQLVQFFDRASTRARCRADKSRTRISHERCEARRERSVNGGGGFESVDEVDEAVDGREEAREEVVGAERCCEAITAGWSTGGGMSGLRRSESVSPARKAAKTRKAAMGGAR